MSDEIPWTVGGKADERDQEGWPGPLNDKWNTIGPLVSPGSHALKNTSRDELAHDETHIGVGREIGSQRSG
jgi:hypothetical protein